MLRSQVRARRGGSQLAEADSREAERLNSDPFLARP
jgi:hypothetical protein